MTFGSFILCRSKVLQNAPEHSAILLTRIKQLLVLKTIFGLIESDRFTQVLLYASYSICENREGFGKIAHINNDK